MRHESYYLIVEYIRIIVTKSHQIIVMQVSSRVFLGTEKKDHPDMDNVTLFDAGARFNHDGLIRRVGPGEYVVNRTSFSEGR